MECHIHGNLGNPNCKECWNALFQMLREHNATVVHDSVELPDSN